MYLTTAAPSSCSIENDLSVSLGLEGGAASDEGGVFMAQVNRAAPAPRRAEGGRV